MVAEEAYGYRASAEGQAAESYLWSRFAEGRRTGVRLVGYMISSFFSCLFSVWFGLVLGEVFFPLRDFFVYLLHCPLDFSSCLYWSNMDRPERFIFPFSSFPLLFLCGFFFPPNSSGSLGDSRCFRMGDVYSVNK